MGWLFPYHTQSKKDIISEITNNNNIVKHCIRGNCLWTIMDVSEHSRTYEKIIVLYLLGTESQGNWGYKDMDESMGPLYYSCPISWFNETDVMNQDWRDRVLEIYKEKSLQRTFKKFLKVGTKLYLKETTIEYVYIDNIIGKNIFGGGYKIPSKFFDVEKTLAAN